MPGPDGPTGWEELTDGVLVAAQPHGAPTWFPCNDRMADKATYRVTVRTDPGYRVVSNGSLTARAPGRPPGRVGARAAPADGHLPRHPADRALRARAPGQRRRRPECAGRPRGPDAGRPHRVRRPAPDARHLRRAVRALPVRRLHRGRHRRRARDPAGVADPVDLRQQPPQPGLGGAAAHRPRAGPPVVRQHGHRRLAERHLAARGVRLLRRVAVVRGRRVARRRRRRPSGTTPSWPGSRRTSCSPTPAPTAPSTTGSTSAARSPCTPCAAPSATTRSSPCCARGSTPTASASSRRPTSRRWCAHETGVDPDALLGPWLRERGPAAAGRRARGRPLTRPSRAQRGQRPRRARRARAARAPTARAPGARPRARPRRRPRPPR